MTTPFVPGGEEFVALYVFDGEGELVEALIDRFGSRESLIPEERREVVERRLADLGPVTFGRIEVAPFSIHRLGIEFGLVARLTEDGEVIVELEPGNYMAFWEPWDSGEYDTWSRLTHVWVLT